MTESTDRLAHIKTTYSWVVDIVELCGQEDVDIDAVLVRFADELKAAKSKWQSQLRKEIEGVIGENEDASLRVGIAENVYVYQANARNELREKQRKQLSLLYSKWGGKLR